MRILVIFFVLLSLACTPKTLPTVDENKLIENTSHLQNPEQAPFFHGVASGDPFQNSVVLWTRVTPEYPMNEVPVRWELATDYDFNQIIQSGQTSTSPQKDYTVKVIPENLQAGTQYYYRFRSLEKYSPTGTTKTLPEQDDTQIKLAFVSCSNIEFGYFNSYAAIADDDVDAVIHLGDYIYEYGPDIYGDTSFFRKNIPPHEIISLQDYRDRYSQYRLDEDLQKVHGSKAFINIWDDHEITNNAYISGAQNHQEDEGDYNQRKNIAKQVFYEWLPIREGKTHYRKFNFGSTLDLIMLDERLAGRTMQPDSMTDPRRTSSEHHLLGSKQMEWLISALTESDAKWKIIGNQVIFSYSDWGYKSFKHNMDAWDGYPNDQDRLTNAIKTNDIKNIVFVTGDTHTAWAFEATSDPFNNYNRYTGEGAIGIEFGVTSINSGNSNERNSDEDVIEHEMQICNTAINPHLKYVNMRDHGYLKLTINPGKIIAEFKIVKTLSEKDASNSIDKTFYVNDGVSHLKHK